VPIESGHPAGSKRSGPDLKARVLLSPSAKSNPERSPQRRASPLDLTIRWAMRCAYPFARAWWWLTRPDVRGAHVAVWRLDAQGLRVELLLVRNSYNSGLTVPGGGISAGESPAEAARRELREEVGLDLPAVRLRASTDFVIEYMHRQDHVHFFDVDLAVDEQIVPVIDGREVIWADFVRCDALRPTELAPPLRRFLAEGGHTTRP
jgi:8-oxo-dGTP diphosphatase